jgi:hypothetical protein
MTNAKIFLVGENSGRWIPMEETPYGQEVVLQAALAEYPDLLPGDQINPENPRRWLLVRREVGVPAEEDGGSVGSLDHLFLDQDGIPTFVECKRAADTRARREVVAQMLDYAANGTEYWPMEKLRQAATETAAKEDRSLDEQVQELVGGEEIEVDTYWEHVEDNLREGRIRLIFVADSIPKELRRLVEFLNDKMTDVEVLAVEVKQYLGHGQKAMVPRVIGMTESARKKKPGGPKHKTNREEFLRSCTSIAADFFKHMLDVSKERRHTIYWGEKGFSVRLHLVTEDRLASFAYGYPAEEFQFYFANLPLNDDESQALRNELMAFDVFKESGQYTLRASISSETEARICELYAFILDKMDEVAKV